MRGRMRVVGLVAAAALAVGACTAGGDSTADPADGTDDADVTVTSSGAGDTDDSDDNEEALDGFLDAVERVVAAQGDGTDDPAVELAAADIDAVVADCGDREAQMRERSDFRERTLTERVPGARQLRCAVFTDSSFAGADVRFIDLAGADLRNADLRGARFESVSLVAADLSGADLRGARFVDSDLRGARLDGANLIGSTLDLVPDGLTSASLVGAAMGCNDLVGGAAMDLTSVTVIGGDQDGDGRFDCIEAFEGAGVGCTGVGQPDTDDDGTFDCVEDAVPQLTMTLRGSVRRSLMPAFDFTHVTVETTDFRNADLRGAVLFDVGVWPTGADFSGANLTEADLGRTQFFRVDFTDARLGGASLAQAYVEGSNFTGALLVDNPAPTDLTDFVSVANRWPGARFDGVVLERASMTRDMLDGAVFDADDATPNVLTDFIITEVVCPDGTPSTRLLGFCLSIEASRAP